MLGIPSHGRPGGLLPLLILFGLLQLFGDTMNTASRLESTGVPGRIQLSEQTAELICAHGKDTWLEERSESVEAKGKGHLKTFFLVFKNDKGTVATNNSSSKESHSDAERY